MRTEGSIYHTVKFMNFKLATIEIALSIAIGAVISSLLQNGVIERCCDFIITLLSPGITVGMIIAGGPHGNMLTAVVAIGIAIQLYLIWMLIKFIYKYA